MRLMRAYMALMWADMVFIRAYMGLICAHMGDSMSLWSRDKVGESGTDATLVVRSRSGMEITDLGVAPTKVSPRPQALFII